jgi:hypothetical protein
VSVPSDPYCASTRGDARDRLYGAAVWDGASWARVASDAACQSRRPLSCTGGTLRIAPFVIRRSGQTYINPATIEVELQRLPAALYRVVAVHNFQVEDRNPDLDTCLAAIFLARRAGDRWEEAEDHPVECRSIEILGYLDSTRRRIVAP